jgi:hypothetical protein
MKNTKQGNKNNKNKIPEVTNVVIEAVKKQEEANKTQVNNTQKSNSSNLTNTKKKPFNKNRKVKEFSKALDAVDMRSEKDRYDLSWRTPEERSEKIAAMEKDIASKRSFWQKIKAFFKRIFNS